MARSFAGRRSVGLARLVGVIGLFGICGGIAAAQESVIFSLSSSATAGFGTLEDTELAIYDDAAGVIRPWLMAPTAAYYAGDVDGDGLTDAWKDVDALYVEQAGKRVTGVQVSFNTSFGPFLDGDLVGLGSTGVLELVHSEAEIVAALGINDGNMDVDALHVGSNGRIYLSFGDDENSAILSTDSPGVITDGSIVWWDPVNQTVGVELIEGQVDAFVSQALNKTTKTADTLGVTIDSNGVICFSVQSPSSDDGAVFSAANGGEYVHREADLGFSVTVEIDALDLQSAPIGFLAARATPRIVPGNAVTTVDVDRNPAAHPFLLLLSTARADTKLFPFKGFFGLGLDPADPLFSASIADLPWAYGVTDVAGHGTIVFPAAPVGVVLTLFCQPYDFGDHSYGTPIAIELTG